MEFIKDQLLTLIQGDDGRRPGSKFIKSLPNAHKFKVIIQGDDIPLLKHGIRKSVKSHLIVVRGQNKKANRYLAHQLIRLERFQPNYWEIVRLLCARSKVWYLAHLQRCFPRWYRQLPKWYSIALWGKVAWLAFNGDETRVKHKRVYIPKKVDNSGKVLTWRPLGVPTPEWRIYLSMLNTALTMWLERHWQNGQHAYFPGKGTISAWRSVLSQIHKKNIYEFDLKSFFPSVEVQQVSKRLLEYGLPKVAVEYFEELNMSLPDLRDVDLIDEDEIRERQETERQFAWDKHIYESLKESLIIEDPELSKDLIQDMHVYEHGLKEVEIFAGSPTGLPQGGGISPVLSVQVLDEIFKHNPTTVMYADDGIIFDWPILESPNYSENGIEFNLEKSGWVKKMGEWIKPLQFLGLTYDGVRDQLWSKTRSGKELLIPKDKIEKILSAVWAYSGGRPTETNVWVKLFNSRIDGLIQAMHYNGVFELTSEWANWDIHSTKSSWMASKTGKRCFKKRKIKPSLYNASTVATKWALGKLRGVRHRRKYLTGACTK